MSALAERTDAKAAQRTRALEKARVTKAAKRDLAAQLTGLTSQEARGLVADLLRDPPRVLQGLRLCHVLRMIPTIGEGTASNLLAMVGAGLHTRITDLSERQRELLADRLADGNPVQPRTADTGWLISRLRARIDRLSDERDEERAARQSAETALAALRREHLPGRRSSTAEYFRLVQEVERLTNDRRALLLAIGRHEQMAHGDAPADAFVRADDTLYASAVTVKERKR
jgi:hypothetical protein